MRKLRLFLVPLLMLILILSIVSCDSAEEPDYAHVVYLSAAKADKMYTDAEDVAKLTGKSDGYKRGYIHGKEFSGLIRSLYTKLLTTSIVPYLNREQVNIAPVLNKYNEPQYLDGKFSYQLLLESAENMVEKKYIPDTIVDEMKGIADGAEIPFEEILILNTFMDTMMGFRAIVSFIQGIQNPYIESFSVDSDLSSDKIDNNGDGELDDENDNALLSYSSSPYAAMLEVPTDAKIKFIFRDPTLGGLECVDARNVESEMTGEDKTPFGKKTIKKSCVKMECIKDEFKNLDAFERDHFNEKGLSCLFPRITADCFDHDCIQPSDPGCVNEKSIRVQLDDQLFTVDTECPDCNPCEDCFDIKLLEDENAKPSAYEGNPHLKKCQGPLQVIFTPPDKLPEASEVSLIIQVGDQSPIYSPEPYHNRFMRDERIVFTTTGYLEKHGKGDKLQDLERRGADDNRSMPPTISFALRGSMVEDGKSLLAHHYALLDNDMVHEHSIIQVHDPEGENPHVLLSIAGLVWGFSGMNDKGVTYAFNNSDTLDNPLVGRALQEIFEIDNLLLLSEDASLTNLSKVLKEVKMLAAGIPVGVMTRNILRERATTDEALSYLHSIPQTYGWNILLGDKDSKLAGVELDSATLTEKISYRDPVEDRDGFMYYTPDKDHTPSINPETGDLYGSITEDDIRMGSHYTKNVEDIKLDDFLADAMGAFAPKMQKGWTGFYYRSLRAYYTLGDIFKDLQKNKTKVNVEKAIEILRTKELVDIRDSMSSAVYEPGNQIVHWAMGKVPATDAPFIKLDLKQVVAEGRAQ